MDLIKEWDDLMEPLQTSNAIDFCEKLQNYMQKSNKDEEITVIYPVKERNKELLFNAPQHKMGYSESLLEQARIINKKLASRGSKI